MKIKEIELNSEEQDKIFNYLVRKFDPRDSGKQTIDLTEYQLNDDHSISADAELELYIESEMTDPDTNSSRITERSVIKFRLTFYYDGEEIKVNDDSIWTRINEYYSI